jgi:hypothetical protein
VPNRILREGILTSPRVSKLGWAEEVFYRRLMSVVDDFGRYYADEGLLRAACYPRQLNKVSDSDIGKWLRACVDAALVRVYPAEDGERYLELLDFRQQARAKKSKFPDMRSTCAADAMQANSRGAADAHLGVFGDVSVDDLPSSDDEGVIGDADDPGHGQQKLPDCPHQAVIAAYHAALPANPMVREWNETRQGYLRQRWREKAVALKWTSQAEGIEWFSRFFGYVAKSEFLTGRSHGKDRKPFLASLEWLMKPSNFAKVIEGQYE